MCRKNSRLGDGVVEIINRRRKEREAVKAFARALLIVPKTLIENAGEDILEVTAELLKANSKDPGKWCFDASRIKVVKIDDANLWDPWRVKRGVLATATEAAITILRIDDVIASKPREEKEKKKGKEEFGEETSKFS